MLTTALVLAAALQAQQSDNVLGWTIDPPAPIAGEETELDRLSRSSSGVSFLSLFGDGGDDDRVALSVTLRALDKVTARFVDLEVPIGEPRTYGTLTLIPRTCSTRPPEEFPETSAFLEVYSGAGDIAGKRARDQSAAELPPVGSEDEVAELILQETAGSGPIGTSIDEDLFGSAVFRGWMFASSPSLNAMEHPTYDVWVIDCKMAEPQMGAL